MKSKDQRKNSTDIEINGQFVGEEPADFERAIAATGFGKFNLLLILVAIPSSWSSHFEATSMSYVFSAAQCDLKLSLEDKGMLNAVTYGGAITSAFFWGLISDNFGRRNTLIAGFLLNGLIASMTSFSFNKYFLMFLKYIGGFLISGPYAALASYFSEFHVGTYRSRVPLLLGLTNTFGGIYLPLLAALIFPMKFHVIIANFLPFHSWGLFLLLNAIPSLISGICFIFLPESPRFLISKGRNEEALIVFQQVYSMNSGRPPATYPIKRLVEEIAIKNDPRKTTFKHELRGGCTRAKSLFLFPYVKIFLLVCGLQICAVMSYSTLRLWMPQLFQAVNDFKFLNNRTSSNVCEVLNVIRPSGNASTGCFVNFDNIEVYVRSAIVATSPILSYFIAGALINALGQKKLLSVVSFSCGCVAAGIYFAPSEDVVTVLLSIFKALGCLGSNITVVIIVNLFPTTLRAMTVGLAIMFGRLAAMLGHIIFPYLIKLGCAPPFFFIASLGFTCTFLALIVPKEKKILL